MSAKTISLFRMIPVGVASMGMGTLIYLGTANLSDEEVPMRLPVAPAVGADGASDVSPLDEAELVVTSELEEVVPGEWLGFRGERRDGVAHGGPALAKTWGGEGPVELWGIDVGEGYAGAAVAEGRVYLMDYDREAQRDALRCLSLADGKELWRFSYPLSVKRNHGMSRTVPVIAGGKVVALGPKCHVSCLDALSGEFQWGMDLVKDYGCSVPAWYAGQCPLVDDGKVILAPAGEVLMMAVDLESGEVIWETPNPQSWKMTHVSIVPATLGGVETYVYCGNRGVVGVAAKDGEILWETKAWKISIATVSSPIPMTGDRLFFSGGYKAGSMMLGVKQEAGEWRTDELFRLDAEVFGATQQTPVLYENFLYGVRPNGELTCLNGEGEVQWTSGMEHRFGLGPVMVADGTVLVINDDGVLTMADAVPDEFKLLDEAAILHGHDAWGPMALADGKLIARDLTRMVCVDLREDKHE